MGLPSQAAQTIPSSQLLQGLYIKEGDSLQAQMTSVVGALSYSMGISCETFDDPRCLISEVSQQQLRAFLLPCSDSVTLGCIEDVYAIDESGKATKEKTYLLVHAKDPTDSSVKDTTLTISNQTVEGNQKISEIISSYREIFLRNRRQFYSSTIGETRFNVANANAELMYMSNFSKYMMEVLIYSGCGKYFPSITCSC